MASDQSKRRVLVVDDEADLVDLLCFNLEKQGYETSTASDGREALASIAASAPDLVVLDVMMPELSGIEVLSRLRSQEETARLPVIMLTAKGEEIDELLGLQVGADDYIAKPFSVKVVLARIETLLRRSGGGASGVARSGAAERLVFGPVELDVGTHEAFVEGSLVHLTLTEFRVLASLLEVKGRVLSRAALIEKAIGPGITVTERTIDVHVTAIRKKLGVHSAMIQTVRGVGYKLVSTERV